MADTPHPLPQSGCFPAEDRQQSLRLLGVTPEALQARLAEMEQPRYRADQVLQWIYERGAAEFDAMSNLPKTLRAALSMAATVLSTQVEQVRTSQDGTHKLLLTAADGAAIETVWIPDGVRHTACLSSQVGCPVGCRFCASGIGGVERDLDASEIVEQAWRVDRLIREATADEARLTNIVMMGMGEPLANYDQVVRALRIINAPWGLNIGARKITVSTVGLPKQIRRLAREGLQLNLALSLHAPDEKLRRKLIPWGKVSLNELLDAVDDYFKTTGREVTLEYVLLPGVNMEPEHAENLARIARRLRANVNLLRYNPVPGAPYQRPTAEAAFQFQQLLRSARVNAHLRRSRGADVDAACGQLRRSHQSAS